MMVECSHLVRGLRVMMAKRRCSPTFIICCNVLFLLLMGLLNIYCAHRQVTSRGSVLTSLRSVTSSSSKARSTLPARHSQSPSCWRGVAPTNIVFLKIHKSGGTTLGNVLARYALNHDLHVALPNKDPSLNPTRSNYFPSPFVPSAVLPLVPGQSYGVLFHHMTYNRSSLRHIMPPGSFYCCMVRRPDSRLLSAFNYYYYILPRVVVDYLNQTRRTVGAYARQFRFKPGRTFNSNMTREVERNFSSVSWGSNTSSLEQLMTDQVLSKMERAEIYNSIAMGSGLPLTHHDNMAALHRHVEKLDREMDLVMIMERFDESLVLLKRRACLGLKDVLYSELNVRTWRYSLLFSKTDLHYLRAWQRADHVLYDHFKARFEALTRAEGEDFPREVQHFRAQLRAVWNFCRSDVKDYDVWVAAASPWNEQYVITAYDCSLLRLSEMDFQKILILREHTRYSVRRN